MTRISALVAALLLVGAIVGVPPVAAQAAQPAGSLQCDSTCISSQFVVSAPVAADSLSVSQSATCQGPCHPKRVDLAVLQVIFVNYLVGSFNRFLRNEPFTYVGPETWATNIREGFNWDDNNFSTNQLAHPFHGSIYFGAGRSNGLDFWESIPLTAGGSLMWEYLGESHRPAFNDWIATTMGGMALGESFYRLSSLVLNNESTGTTRALKEIAGGLLSPMRGFNRLMRGDVSYIGPSDFERDPGFFAIRVDAGARAIGEGESLENGQTHGFVSFDFQYGDMFAKDYRKPFDTFRLSVQLNGRNKQALGRVQVEGVLYSSELTRTTKHLFRVWHNYDYINNDALEFGRNGVTLGVNSRFPVSDKLEVRTTLGGNIIVLGGINSEFVGVQDRSYDFGPGVGVQLQARLVKSGSLFRYLAIGYSADWIHTVSGADGEHLAQLAFLTSSIPVWGTLGIGADASVSLRNSYFNKFPDTDQRNPQLRLYLTWWLR